MLSFLTLPGPASDGAGFFMAPRACGVLPMRVPPVQQPDGMPRLMADDPSVEGGRLDAHHVLVARVHLLGVIAPGDAIGVPWQTAFGENEVRFVFAGPYRVVREVDLQSGGT